MTEKHLNCNLLFVYGTLQIKGNHFADFLSQNARNLGSAILKGELFDLGNYPGAVYLPNSTTDVQGTVFELQNVEAVLKELDFYEGIGAAGCEYVREIVPVEASGQTILCWFYRYILDTSTLFKIADGDYLKYLNNR